MTDITTNKDRDNYRPHYQSGGMTMTCTRNDCCNRNDFLTWVFHNALSTHTQIITFFFTKFCSKCKTSNASPSPPKSLFGKIHDDLVPLPPTYKWQHLLQTLGVQCETNTLLSSFLCLTNMPGRWVKTGLHSLHTLIQGTQRPCLVSIWITLFHTRGLGTPIVVSNTFSIVMYYTSWLQEACVIGITR